MTHLMMPSALVTVVFALAAPAAWGADALPFQQQVEVYRNEKGDVIVFRLRLEQPFLAEEFETSNYLRLQSDDQRAYLIYPKKTKFHQKQAEFYGRLRGKGDVTLQLAYEIVSENPDGSRRVEVRKGKVNVAIPSEKTGSERIFHQWAQQQNVYFAHLLRYYPQETFFQYCLLQSQARYGVAPPPLPKQLLEGTTLETGLYHVFTGSMAIQESLQHETLRGGRKAGDLNRHISTLQPPRLRSLPYKDLLEKKLTRDGVKPKVHAISKLVPEDQYFLHFNTMEALSEVTKVTTDWGDNLMRFVTVRAQDNQVSAKLEDQLGVRWEPLRKLFTDGAIREVAVTGADPFVLEGTDVTLIFHVSDAKTVEQGVATWLGLIRKKYPQITTREFNYRGHKVKANYTKDRVVSSFITQHGEYLVFSNSHRAIRRVIDVSVGLAPSLHDSLDYRYVTTILPPVEKADSGYFFGSEAFIKRMVGPAAKISQKRRKQCFNNLVMLNNASLLFRLENGRSPESLSELIEGRFVDPKYIVCPHGGGYAIDAEHDMCTCSLHNRLRYLTPNVELTVLNVSAAEATEYERYKTRYQAFWQQMFDPIATRITVGQRIKLETCVLPLANGSLYRNLQSMVAKNPQPIGTAKIAPSAVVSLILVPGRENIAEVLRQIPGVAEVLKADPTLTDLQWVGDCAGLHFCDGETILQVDPTQLSNNRVPIIGRLPMSVQVPVTAAVMAASLPVYITVDVENPDLAARLLEQLSQQVFLQKSAVAPGMQIKLDAYRLPDYKDHAAYVFNIELYALKIRLHVALVGDQLVAATKPEILREVIDASKAKETGPPVKAHMLLRLNLRALDRMTDDLELYWAEKSRTACHRNISSIYNLCKLYGVPAKDVWRLSEAKYGVRYFCPDGGNYTFDAERDQVMCSVHGNREQSQQHPRLGQQSSFARFLDGLNEVVAALRFEEDALIATVEISREISRRNAGRK